MAETLVDFGGKLVDLVDFGGFLKTMKNQ